MDNELGLLRAQPAPRRITVALAGAFPRLSPGGEDAGQIANDRHARFKRTNPPSQKGSPGEFPTGWATGGNGLKTRFRDDASIST